MTYEKHTTHTDALDTLGEIIDETQKRDAIHLAVEPVVAGQRLAPGQHVRFNDDGEAVAAYGDNGVGIVDPFLKTLVELGERFWLVVYPRQISSLRHVWEHPSFPPSGETQPSEPAPVSEIEITPKLAAEQWLKAWMKTADGMGMFDLEDLIEAIEDGESTGWPRLEFDGDYLSIVGAQGGGEVPSEFWDMASIAIGRRVEGYERFSCGC